MTSTPTHNSPDIDPTVSTGDEVSQELPPTTSAQPIKAVSTQVLQTQGVAVVTLLLLIVLCVMGTGLGAHQARRSMVGAEGFASGIAFGWFFKASPLHLSLGEFGDLALFHRGRCQGLL